MWNNENKWSRILLFLSILIVPLTAYLRVNERWAYKPDDTFQIHKTELRNAIPKDALVVTGNDVSAAIFHYYLDRKGWSFSDNNLTGKQLRKYISEGAEYLVSTSRQVETSFEVKDYLREEIYSVEEVKIFRLQENKRKAPIK